MTIENLCVVAHFAARDKGFWDKPPTALESYALIISEVAEAIEAVRSGKAPYYLENGKPEGQLAEMADVVIRVADLCGSRGWDLQTAIEEKLKFNKTRPQKHGKLL